MRILITGIGGFAGKHLTRCLLEKHSDCKVHGTLLSGTPQSAVSQVTYHELDLRDEAAVEHIIRNLQPDYIYHLAAQASPWRSFSNPWETLENNIRGQLNLIQACLAAKLQPRMLVVSSAEIYKPPSQDFETAITEDTPLWATSPYGVSKIAQDMLGLQYYLSHEMPIIRARPFNHFGPGQSEGFVAPDFATQIAKIESGQREAIIEVGNLSAKRDFTDVRDVVKAYQLIAEQGTPGEVYNIASGKVYSIQEVLDTLLGYSTRTIEVRVDSSRFLPVDVPIKRGDAKRLYEATGWQPVIPFEQSLLDILNDCRKRTAIVD